MQKDVDRGGWQKLILAELVVVTELLVRELLVT
jgi:hypothetical protein